MDRVPLAWEQVGRDRAGWPVRRDLAENSFTHLVVVGSSAGGIGALSELLANLPENFATPVVIAQHLDPKRESHLRDILSRRSSLPVKTVTGHETLEAGVVFVVPANRHVNITDSEISFDPGSSSSRAMPSIDILMRSAAEIFGENLIAVVLTGTGSDGTDGARAVSQVGGTVIIQDPETAEFGEMPRSLAPSTVDIVADLERIGPVLQNLVSGIASGAAKLQEQPEGEEEALERLLKDLHRHRGMDFRSYKRPTIARRLGRRLVATDCGSIADYSRYLEENPEEYRKLVSAFLIKVTEFFRDPELFDYLKDEVMPGLIEEAREKAQLRLWSAGCATGEEAYSLAILISEALGEEAGLFNVRIFATDIDEEAIRFARNGIYSSSALDGLSEEQVDRYFIEENGSYQVKKQVRSMIIFGEHDLTQRSPFPQIDLVMSRNVLIYFSSDLQRRALQLFAYSLRDDGYLVMGKAESPSLLDEFFVPSDRNKKIYHRRGARFLMPHTLPAGTAPRPRPSQREPEPGRNLPKDRDPPTAAPRATGEDLLNRLPVGVALVGRDYVIAAINDAARRLLSIPGVAVGEDFLHSAQETPYAEVRRAIDGAFQEGEITQSGEFAVEEATTGEPSYLRLTCHPQPVGDEARRAENVLVVVEDVTAAVRVRRLTGKNRRLETANRELGQLNEKLRSVHEESLMNTEEHQAAAEEVETLNEELQATNEELETPNEELQELAQGREDERQTAEEARQRAEDLVEQVQSERSRLEAILANMSDAVLAVDAAGKALFGNQVFEEIFGELTAGAPGFLGSKRVLDENGEELPAEATPLGRAAAGVLEILGENLGWQVALLWVVDEEEKILRCSEVWQRPGASDSGFEEACRETDLQRGEGLPGRAWAENRFLWARDLRREKGSRREVGVSEGLRGALAFPINVGNQLVGVIELLGSGILQLDQELLYTVNLIGRQLGQYIERRRVEAERERLSREIASERARLVAVLRQMPAGVFIAELSGEYLFSNEKAEHLYGRTVSSIADCGQSLYSYPDGEQVPWEDLPMVRSLERGEVVSGVEHCVHRPNGTKFVVSASSAPVTDEAGRVVAAVESFLDITDLKRAERERARLHSLEVGARAEDAERKRISRELHDRVAHSMGVVHQSLQLYEVLREKDPERAKDKLRVAKEMARRSLEQTRNLSSELRRSETEDGLVPALRDLLEVAVPDGLGTELSVSGETSLLADRQRGQIYLILREAVRNAVKHSGCSRITIGLDVTPQKFSGFVRDDGRGLNGGGVEGGAGSREGFGVRSMNERAGLLEGEIELHSLTGGGTGVELRVPLSNGGES